MTSFAWPKLRPGISALGLVLLVGLAGCSGNSGASGGKPRVVATTVQIAALTKEVGGDKIDLTGIIPAGADAHAYEPKPSDLAAIEQADLILRNGIGLDDWLDDTLQAGADAKLVTVTEGIVVNHETTGEDPHVWHDPDNDKIMVDAIASALEDADPDNTSTYEANASGYRQKLDDTKTEVQAIINEIPPDERRMVTDHDAFGYFARAFGLEIVGAVIPSISTDAEASAQDTAALLQTIRDEHVKAIFAESSANPQLARTLANDAGVTIVDDLYGDSLGQPGSGADTVDGMLLYNARKIAEALQ